jgi:hypothetical protein
MHVDAILIHGDVVMGRPDDVSPRHFADVSPDKVKEAVLLLGGRKSQYGPFDFNGANWWANY